MNSSKLGTNRSVESDGRDRWPCPVSNLEIRSHVTELVPAHLRFVAELPTTNQKTWLCGSNITFVPKERLAALPPERSCGRL